MYNVSTCLHRQQCGPYSGSTCNQVFGSSAQVLSPSIVSSGVDLIINAVLNVARNNFGSDFTPQCENVATYLLCIESIPPCMDRVWCSDLSANDLQQRINESCPCSGNTPNCGQFVNNLREQAGNLTNYYETDQAPSGTTCQAVTLGEASDHRLKLLFITPSHEHFNLHCIILLHYYACKYIIHICI